MGIEIVYMIVKLYLRMVGIGSAGGKAEIHGVRECIEFAIRRVELA